MKQKKYLYIDFGSIYTKLVAIDIESEEILGIVKSPSTYDTNIIDSYNRAMEMLIEKIGKVDFVEKLACCSIEEGLRIVTVGLVHHLSADAARKVALGAGVNVIKSYSGKLTVSDIEEINSLNIDMVLLCGGTDGGNKDDIIINSNKIIGLNRKTSIIYAGNKDAAYICRDILERDFSDFRITENVMPSHNILNFEPVRKTIKEAYVEKINKLKGFSKIHREISGIVMPTSYAILNAASLLSQGTKDIEGLSELMVVDCGGGSTNVYSIASGTSENGEIINSGIFEAYEKRTYENFGLRFGIEELINQIEDKNIESELEISDISNDIFENYINTIRENPSHTVANKDELNIEGILSRFAIERSVINHSGQLTKKGKTLIQTGKDLTGITKMIVIGGSLTLGNDIKDVLDDTMFEISHSKRLIPKHPQYFTYNENSMYAFGLLSEIEPNVALKMLKKYLINI